MAGGTYDVSPIFVYAHGETHLAETVETGEELRFCLEFPANIAGKNSRLYRTGGSRVAMVTRISDWN